MKKMVIFIGIILILLFGIFQYYEKYKTVECWWGVLYPNLSYIGFEDNQEQKLSSLDAQYIPSTDNRIHYRFFIVDWFNNLISF